MKEGIYRHYKGRLYRLLCVAMHTETMEEMVVYQDVIDEEKFWVRPKFMWMEKVSAEGREVPRFRYLAASMAALDEKRMFRLIEAIKESMQPLGRLSVSARRRCERIPANGVLHR